MVMLAITFPSSKVKRNRNFDITITPNEYFNGLFCREKK